MIVIPKKVVVVLVLRGIRVATAGRNSTIMVPTKATLHQNNTPTVPNDTIIILYHSAEPNND